VEEPGDLTARQEAKLASIAQTNKVLCRAYLLKEQLRQGFALKGAEGIALLDAWLKWARRLWPASWAWPRSLPCTSWPRWSSSPTASGPAVAPPLANTRHHLPHLRRQCLSLLRKSKSEDATTAVV